MTVKKISCVSKGGGKQQNCKNIFLEEKLKYFDKSILSNYFTLICL